MKKKTSKSEYEVMIHKSRLFVKKFMEFAFRELKDAPVKIDESNEPQEIKLIIRSNKMEKRIRILVEYMHNENRYSVEITDFSESNFFNFTISTDANSEYEKLIPAALKKALRNKYLKLSPDIN